jgi:steroid 5-alpha reductase family enzyme
MQFSCFCVAAWLKFDKVRRVCGPAPRASLKPFCVQITDLSGSSNFVLLALLSLFVGGSDDPMRYTSRRIVMSTIVCASRVALALFLFYRVIRRGKDARFDGIRENFLVRFGTLVKLVWWWLIG